MQEFFKNTANILGISRKIVSIGNTASKKKMELPFLDIF